MPDQKFTWGHATNCFYVVLVTCRSDHAWRQNADHDFSSTDAMQRGGTNYKYTIYYKYTCGRSIYRSIKSLLVLFLNFSCASERMCFEVDKIMSFMYDKALCNRVQRECWCQNMVLCLMVTLDNALSLPFQHRQLRAPICPYTQQSSPRFLFRRQKLPTLPPLFLI